MMFKIPYKLLIYLFIFTFTITLKSKSEIVNQINITGNDRIPDETIKMFSGVKINEDISLNDVDKILKNIFKSEFFSDVKVRLDNNILNIDVKERPIIENIKYEGLKANTIKEEILNNKILKRRSSFDENALKKDRDNILTILKDIGYYFAKVETLIENKKNNKIKKIYKIDLGSKSKIKKIKFIGNKIYKNKKLKNIIVSEEYKFWKFISGKNF